MDEDQRVTRRAMLGSVGAAITGSSVLLAGCNEPGANERDNVDDPDEADDATGGDQGEDGSTNETPEDAADDGGTGGDENETDGADSGENDSAGTDAEENESEGEQELEGPARDVDWADADRIELEAVTSSWIGSAPLAIEDDENPTLTLYEGREYEFVLENGDGQEHNIAFFADDELIQSSGFFEEEGETLSTVVEITADTNEYRCENHPDTMVGEIDVETEE